MTKKQKKTLFLAEYRKTMNKSVSMIGLFTSGTLYKWIKDDEEFRDGIEEIELSLVHKAEEKFADLLDSENERLTFDVAKEIINSKIGKKHSKFTSDDKADISINADKIEYIVK